jgi:hypothetical protein
MTALVAGVMAASNPSGERHRVSSISANTGTAPAMSTDSMVATKVKGGTITSSPAPTPQAAMAVDSAAVPLAQRCAYSTPNRRASSVSNVLAFQCPLRASSKP